MRGLRTTKNDVLEKAEEVNEALRNIKIVPSFKYRYTTLDVYDKQGRLRDSLVADALTKREALLILNSIETVLWYES